MSTPEPARPDRRTLLRSIPSLTMVAGLLAAYGTFFGYAGRYLFPTTGGRKSWLFVARTEDLEEGDSITYTTPSGASVVVARKGPGDEGEDFLALSSICPHLGCQVKWEPHNDRFFCPCHNGVFDPEGRGIAGPPKGL